MTTRFLTAIVDDNNHLDTPEARRSLRVQFAHFFKQGSPRLLLLNFIVLFAARVFVGGFTATELLFVVGVAVWWPVQEWAAHRYLLHLKPHRFFGFTIDPLAARAHRQHHRQPWVIETTLLPQSVVLMLIPIHALAWWLFTPSLEFMLAGASAYAVAAIVYEWTHYICHAHYVPQGAYYRRIWKNHRLHHFKNEHHWFAFTVPHIDTWMGTDPPVATVETSDTVRTLGVDE
jgi:hypothetical protein